jgi:hypothetical protein
MSPWLREYQDLIVYKRRKEVESLKVIKDLPSFRETGSLIASARM